MMAGRTNQMTRKGPGAAGFLAEDVLPSLTAKAVSFIRENAKAPFFLYLPLTSPHTPIAPSGAWKGKSGLNPYGDFVMETDAAVGQVLAALEKAGVSQNTIVFFASDNGCAPLADIEELRSKGHDPVPGLRGAKADIFEGGHRVPLIVRWPGHVKKGSRSDQLVSLNDFIATVAAVLNRPLPDDAGEDSVSLLGILTGRAKGPVREALVHHSVNGSFAIRRGPWKLEFCPDSGGWAAPRPGSKEAQTLPKLQLYNLALDPKETKNLQADQPLIRDRLVAMMQRYVQSGRSTPGAPQTNTSPVVYQK
jgi:arylsulfatase A-like enzyme